MTRVGALGTTGLKEAPILPESCVIWLCCAGRGAPSVSWQLREDNPRVHASGCRDVTGLSCSQLVLRRATANDTGYLSCALNSTPEHQGLVARIYVFVQGKNSNFFLNCVRLWELCEAQPAMQGLSQIPPPHRPRRKQRLWHSELTKHSWVFMAAGFSWQLDSQGHGCENQRSPILSSSRI